MLQPMQKVRAEQERNRNYRAVFHLADKKFVQLATPDMPTVAPGEDLARAIGMSDLPYRMEVSWDQSYNDVFLLDLKTGKPSRVLEHWGSNATTMSPGGKYVLYFDETNGNWFTYRVSDGDAREPHRQDERPVPAEQRRSGSPRRIRSRRLDSR